MNKLPDLDTDSKATLISRRETEIEQLECTHRHEEKKLERELVREAQKTHKNVLRDLKRSQYSLNENGVSSWRYEEGHGWYRAQEIMVEGISEPVLTFCNRKSMNSLFTSWCHHFLNHVLVKLIENDPDITDQLILESYHTYLMESLLGDKEKEMQ